MADRWRIAIDRITEECLRSFGGLTPEELNRTFGTGSWSIAKNLEHLVMVNGSYFVILKRIRKGNYSVPFTGRLGWIVRLSGELILRGSGPDRKRRMRTFPIWDPSAAPAKADILREFERHQEELKRRIADSQDLIEQGTVISSPANKWVVYTLEKAFDIIVAHESRHLAQAKEVLSSMKGG